MGTSRSALYRVLHDENEFSSDDIQQPTYLGIDFKTKHIY